MTHLLHLRRHLRLLRRVLPTAAGARSVFAVLLLGLNLFCGLAAFAQEAVETDEPAAPPAPAQSAPPLPTEPSVVRVAPPPSPPMRIPGRRGVFDELVTTAAGTGIWRTSLGGSAGVVVVVALADRGLAGSQRLREALTSQRLSSWLLLAEDDTLPGLQDAVSAARARAAALPVVLLASGAATLQVAQRAAELPVDGIVLLDVPSHSGVAQTVSPGVIDAASGLGDVRPLLLAIPQNTLLLQRTLPLWWLVRKARPAGQDWRRVPHRSSPEWLARRIRGWLERSTPTAAGP